MPLYESRKEKKGRDGECGQEDESRVEKRRDHTEGKNQSMGINRQNWRVLFLPL